MILDIQKGTYYNINITIVINEARTIDLYSNII